ncbi:peptidase S41-like protein [Chitinophaga skermanii]|uniref:Peptidase S41-like protein n=1 Tax=Chitinophaga skermanii TaxID=331697 RepID=A0A327QLH8_9BACT|nr:S41 family peptidase [Chitinophaga skermanii]RAJ05526.1 peptidase S41-like protein [Chitinophaga skermanii]
MKKLLLSLAFITTATGLQAQHKLFDSVFTLIQTKSVYANTVNWDSIKPVVYKQIDDTKADSIEAFIPAVNKLLQSLGDMHSSIAYKGQYSGNPDAYAYVRKKIDSVTLKAAYKGLGSLHTVLLKGNYGYINIPVAGVEPTEDMNAAIQQINGIAQSIADSLSTLLKQPLKGLIVDLRLNGGGSSPALVGGLAALLPAGTCFAFSNYNASKDAMVLKNGSLFYDTLQMTRLTNVPTVPKKLPVAVLINGYTTSAGEHVAIALKTVPRYKFFGTPTRGQITGNESIFLRKDLVLSLSTAWAEDGLGRKYPVDVQPDVFITKGFNFEDKTKDSCILAAIEWFKTSK